MAIERHPEATVAGYDLELVRLSVPNIEAGQVLIRNVYLSLDPRTACGQPLIFYANENVVFG